MSRRSQDIGFMSRALELAHKAEENGEVPVGAVVVSDNKIIGEGANCPVLTHDPSGHAEIVALRDAGVNSGNYRQVNATLYTTLEPCIMCAGALLYARINRLVFAVYDEKSGAAGSQLNLLQSPLSNHRCSITAGILEPDCQSLLQGFFQKRR